MVTLQEKLRVVSQMESEGCDSTTIEAMLECLEGRGTVYASLTPAILEAIINEED